MLPKYFVGKAIERIVALPREAKDDPDMEKKLSDAKKAMRKKIRNAQTSDIQDSSAAPADPGQLGGLGGNHSSNQGDGDGDDDDDDDDD